MLAPGRRVGVLTVNAASLTGEQLEGAGIGGIYPGHRRAGRREGVHAGVARRQLELDVDLARQENLRVARRLIADHPDVGAIVLECTNMPPYAADIQRETGLPVFDIVSLVRMAHDALVAGLAPRRTRGILDDPTLRGHALAVLGACRGIPMLSREDNALLTRVDRGIRMGDVMRRYWVPALLAREVAEPDGHAQDRAIQESMGRVIDRRREHLGPADKAIIRARWLLLEAVWMVQAGGTPRGVRPTYYSIRAAECVVPKDADWREVLRCPRCGRRSTADRLIEARFLPLEELPARRSADDLAVFEHHQAHGLSTKFPLDTFFERHWSRARSPAKFASQRIHTRPARPVWRGSYEKSWIAAPSRRR